LQSYHDLAVRLEPIILELERERKDLLIIAHESVLRVLYGYLMACNAPDIPKLSFPRNEIIEIIPASYDNKAVRIPIPDLPSDTIPGSPEDIRIPVPPSVPQSGTITPIHIGTGAATPVDDGKSPKKVTIPERMDGALLLVERALKKSGEELLKPRH
jgi:6-phosphofructo-2-kinase / fructose-2,6-biphosphatase 4